MITFSGIMIFRLFISICGYVLLPTAAVLQKPPPLSNETAIVAFSAQNITVPDGRALPVQNISLGATDPRFFTLVRDGRQDLTPKSVYINTLQALETLADLPFQDDFDGERWSVVNYQDVEIVVDPHEGLQVKYAMWGVYHAVAHIIEKNFINSEIFMFYNDGPPVGVLALGTVRISKPQQTSISSVSESSAGGLNSSSSNNSPGSDDKIDIEGNNITAIGTDNHRLTFQLTGARLNKNGVWAVVFEAICEVASWNRAQHLEVRARIIDDDRNVELVFQPVVDPGPPYLDYASIIFMLAGIPKYMVTGNRFQAGSFVVERNDERVGSGEIYRITGTSVA